jgi:hypothetical protein
MQLRSVNRFDELIRPIVDQKIEEMLQQGIIVPSSSPWCSPVVLVPKKGPKDLQNPQDWRLCIDYRRLNDVTIADQYPLPRCDDMLEYLNGNKYFSSLDLVSGYHQLPIHPDSTAKTAFAVAGGSGLYEFLYLSFGLKSAPATFERMVETLFRSMLYKELVLYIDDLLIGAVDVPQMLERLRKVFTILQQAGLKIKPSKCKLFQTRIKFLGHMISEEGIQTDPDKIDAVRDWPTPKNAKEAHSFIGLAAYYRRFIKNFAQIAQPLYQLVNVPPKDFQWFPEHQHAFDKLKEQLTFPNLLAYPDYTPRWVNLFLTVMRPT